MRDVSVSLAKRSEPAVPALVSVSDLLSSPSPYADPTPSNDLSTYGHAAWIGYLAAWWFCTGWSITASPRSITITRTPPLPPVKK